MKVLRFGEGITRERIEGFELVLFLRFGKAEIGRAEQADREVGEKAANLAEFVGAARGHEDRGRVQSAQRLSAVRLSANAG